MELIVTDLSQHGVSIHGPESPDFKDRLSAIVATPTDLDEDALRYSIVVENQTPQSIVMMTMVWRFYSSQGEPVTYSSSFKHASNEVFSNVSGGLIMPGAQAPWSPLGRGRFGMPETVLFRGEDSFRDNLDQTKTLLSESVKWSVDMDGVLFSDGVFVGPDTTWRFGEFEARVRAARDLIAELNQKLDDGESAIAHAERYSSITNQQLKAQYPHARAMARNLDFTYAWTKKQVAGNVVARWRKIGEQATVDWIRSSAQSHIPLVRL